MYFKKDLVFRVSIFILPQIALVFKSQQKLFGHPDLDQKKVEPHFLGNFISDFLEFEVPKVGQVWLGKPDTVCKMPTRWRCNFLKSIFSREGATGFLFNMDNMLGLDAWYVNVHGVMFKECVTLRSKIFPRRCLETSEIFHTSLTLI